MKKYLILSLLILASCKKSDVKPTPENLGKLSISMDVNQVKTAGPDQIKAAMQGNWICDSTKTKYLTLDLKDSLVIDNPRGGSLDVGIKLLVVKDTLTLMLNTGKQESEGVFSISQNPSDTLFMPPYEGMTGGRLLIYSIGANTIQFHTVPGRVIGRPYYTSVLLYYSRIDD